MKVQLIFNRVALKALKVFITFLTKKNAAGEQGE